MAELPSPKERGSDLSHSSRRAQAGPSKEGIRLTPEKQIEKWEKEYSQRLRLVCRMNHCSEEEEDILQEVWIVVFSVLQKGEEIREPGPYLSSIARNKCRDLHRPCHQKQKSLEHPEHVEDYRNEFRSIEDDEICRRLQQAIGELPDKIREVMRLWMMGISVADIADFLGIARRTVYRRLHAARRQIEPWLALLILK